VTELAAKHDIVIVSFHGGAEGNGAEVLPFAREIFAGEDRGNVVEFAHAMIDAGADIVLGHGPHVVRPLEIYKDRLIAYSLGNFATYYGISVEGIRGIAPILLATFDDEGRFVSGKIEPTIQLRPAGPSIDPDRKVIALPAQPHRHGIPEWNSLDRRRRHADEVEAGALMRKLVRWLGATVGVAALAVVALASWVYLRSEAYLHSFERPPPFALAIPDDEASRTRGEHLVRTRGCGGCHGADLGGQLMWGYAVPPDLPKLHAEIAPRISRQRFATVSITPVEPLREHALVHFSAAARCGCRDIIAFLRAGPRGHSMASRVPRCPGPSAGTWRAATTSPSPPSSPGCRR
jgi:hypothetical protein